MSTWVMTTKRVPGGIDICIGIIHVASVRFTPKGGAALWIMVPEGECGTFSCENVSEAFRLMHEKLRAPPPEGYGVGRKQ